jgi:hypothetical protein
MRMAATFFLTMMLALSSGGAIDAADPVPPIDLIKPPEAIKAAESTAPADAHQPRRPAARRLDPSACAELCRFFERMWSLEKRVPDVAAPTS